MKARIVLTLLSLTIGFAVSYAQTEEAEDSCAAQKTNTLLYKEALEAGDAAKAYSPWKLVLAHAPLSSVDVYADGTRILRTLLSVGKDSIQREKWLAELMSLYDQQILLSDSLEKLSGLPQAKGAVLGTKVHDYLAFSGKTIDVEKAYRMEKTALEQEKIRAPYFMYGDLMKLSFQKLSADSTHEEQFIKDYLSVSGYIEAALKQTKDERLQTLLKNTRNHVSTLMIESHVFTGQRINALYTSKVEECRTDSVALKEIISTLQHLKYTSEDAYLMAVEAWHDMCPTAETAMNCALLYKKRKKTDKYIEYVENAVALEKSSERKSAYYYETAKYLLREKQSERAKRYALKATAYTPGQGRLYILMAQIYASKPNWSDNALLNKCTFIAIVDKLRQAKSVEPAVTSEVDKMITVYSDYIPKADELQSLGLYAGCSMNIGGWINETITITD